MPVACRRADQELSAPYTLQPFLLRVVWCKPVNGRDTWHYTAYNAMFMRDWATVAGVPPAEVKKWLDKKELLNQI